MNLFKTGSTLICILLAVTLGFSQEIKIKKKKGKFGLFEKSKNISGYIYDEIENKNNNWYAVRQNNKWGIVDRKGIQTVKCKYDTLIRAGKNKVIAIQNDKYGVLNLNGKEIVEFKYDDIDHYHSNFGALVKFNGSWGLLKNDSIDYTLDKIVFWSPDIFPLFEFCNEFEDNKKELKNCSDNRMLKHIYSSIKYPDIARENNVQGTVVVSFTVSKSGKIKDAKILRDIGAGCGQEVLRIVNKMKDWIPGIQDGEKVATQFNLPVKFRLN